VSAPERRTVDVEWRAFEAGAKPALRVSATPAEAPPIATRYAAAGASVVTSDVITLRGQPTVIVYVARSEGDAAALLNAERRLIEWPTRRARRLATLELGELLGYPSCCVRAFVRRNHGGAAEWLAALATRKRGHDAYLGARDANVPRPVPRINPLLMPERRSFISFDPCRYDCPAAIAVADSCVAALEGADANWVELALLELARPIAVAASGARAHVELERASTGSRVAAAEAPRDTSGDAREADRELARVLVGRTVGRGGLVRGWPAYSPPVVVDFSAIQMA
jgi:hypothetical protein